MAKLLLITRASKLSPLKRVRLIEMLLHDGAGVLVNVGVKVGVRVRVGVRVMVGVRLGVAVNVFVGVGVIEGVLLGIGVFVGTVGILRGNGVLMARVARNCSTIPSR